MKALTWQGNHDVRVEEVPDPRIEQPTDAIIKVTSSGICGSDLSYYFKGKSGDFALREPFVLGHEVVVHPDLDLADNAFGFQLHDAIDQEKGVAMRQYFAVAFQSTPP